MGFSKFAFFHRAMLCGHSHHWLLVTSLGGSALYNSHSRAVGRPPVSFLKRRGLPAGSARSARPLLNRLYFVDILCIFIEICWSIPCWCDAPPRDPLTFLKGLPGVVRPGAQQASWSPKPLFSLILKVFSSPRVMRN
jgi:hypothetical protein